MRFVKYVYLAMALLGSSPAIAEPIQPQTQFAATINWTFGGNESPPLTLGLQADYGLHSGPQMSLAALSWQPLSNETGGVDLSLAGVPLVQDSVRANASAAKVAGGVTVTTIALVAVGAALAAAAFANASEEIARCVANPECGDDEEDSSNEEEEPDDSSDDDSPLGF